MRTIHLLLFPIACWLFFPINVYAQNLTYEVYKGNSKIGEMDVKRHYNNGTWTYSSDSKVQVSFLVSVDLQFMYEATFTNNTLQRSLTQNMRDGKIRESSKGRRVGNQYVTDVNGETNTTSVDQIDECILTLYYHEPEGKTQIFSERWGKFIPVKKLGTHKYALVLPNGDENHMTYEKGICTELQINHTLATLYFKLKNNLPGRLVSE
ncbi:MAG: hypothetical protein KDD63_21410 [Bacteroidetes bacterium]|nr:hypothetical protein [Bacteroidota bacterium]